MLMILLFVGIVIVVAVALSKKEPSRLSHGEFKRYNSLIEKGNVTEEERQEIVFLYSKAYPGGYAHHMKGTSND